LLSTGWFQERIKQKFLNN